MTSWTKVNSDDDSTDDSSDEIEIDNRDYLVKIF